MNKVMRLVRIQLWAVLGDMLSIGNSRKKKPRLIQVGVTLFILGMSAISLFYCYMVGLGLKAFGSIHLLPALMVAVTSIMVLMTTTLKIKGTIFGFKDYDMVMSLPISTGAVVGSRLILLYALNIIFVLMIMVPMTIAYGVLARPDFTFYIFNVISIFFIPLVPIVIASFVGTLIAYVASRFRYSNVLNILFSLVLLTAVMVLSFTIGDNGQELVDISKALSKQVGSLYPLAGMYTKAVAEYDVWSFLSFLIISVIAFLLYIVLVQKVFKKMNTLIMTGRYRTNFKLGELKTATPLKAMYIKELKRYFASPVYVLNTGFGIVLLTLGAIALLFVDLNQILGVPEAVQSLTGMVPIYVTFCIMMTNTTMASISLEGKNLWIIKSLPLSPRTVFLSKIAVNLTIVAPAFLDVILIGIGLKMGISETLLLLVITVATSLFISFYGLLINVVVPNFNWTAEALVVKQSASSLICIFSGFGIVGIQAACLFLIPSTVLAYLLYIVLMLLLDLIVYRILMTYGSRKYQEL